MAFIGIITSTKNEETLKKTLVKTLKNCNVKHNLIIINEENIDNMKNIKFNSIIMNKENNIEENKKDILNQIINNTKYLIINSDIYTNKDEQYNSNATIITYGYNLDATLTTSSVSDEEVLLCIQRDIQLGDKTKIEPKEIYSHILGKDVYNTMANNAVRLLYK
ncbi:MAG: hypothetical protein IJ223_00240 [Clostridia bacterium]|nr:hypothetical protein [Clostridia bacterium]